MFILTANITDTIPSALLDRMEVITLPGYTEEEKMEIARGLPAAAAGEGKRPQARQLTISDGALRQIITSTPPRPGCAISNARSAPSAARSPQGRRRRQKKFPGDLAGNLGQVAGDSRSSFPKWTRRRARWGWPPGLAWTQVGGEVLYVEASLIKGKGELIVTGQLGEVMQESARAAMTYARANLKAFGQGTPLRQPMCTSTCRPGPFPRTAPRPGSPWPPPSSPP
jgi:ATP-dependent Lon protease